MNVYRDPGAYLLECYGRRVPMRARQVSVRSVRSMRSPRSCLRLALWTLAVVIGSGCYLSHESDTPAVHIEPGPCGPSGPPRCIVSDSPCAPPHAVDALCVVDQWACPRGARVYQRPWLDDMCTPLLDEVDPFVDGVHDAPVPVAIDEQCQWLVPFSGPGVMTPNHAPARSGRACDEVELVTTAPIVDVPDPSVFVGIQASVLDANGDVRPLVRGWRYDPLAAFGVRGLGVGFATVAAGRVEVGGAWLFGEDLDLGDAALRFDGHVYAYGCPGTPGALEEDCIVGRAPVADMDDPRAWRLFGDDGWTTGAASRVFGSGPHRGPVFADPRGDGFVHIYAIGFGSTLEIVRAPAPQGPWSSATTLAPCELPADDPHAYCAGPVVYLELWDPFARDELIVGYSIGTTAEDGDRLRAADPHGYWPKVARLGF